MRILSSLLENQEPQTGTGIIRNGSAPSLLERQIGTEVVVNHHKLLVPLESDRRTPFPADEPGRHEPGTGTFPFHEFLGVLKDGGYAGFVGFELFPKSDDESALVAMSELVE